MIAAIDSSRGLAKCGCQPWHLPTDERYFTDQTKGYGGRVLMGRTTFDGLSGPLKDRHNFVLTHGGQLPANVKKVNDLEAFLEPYRQAEGEHLWVIGGAAIFEQTIAAAHRLYLTQIEASFNCDRFFPDYSSEFRLASQPTPRSENGFTYRFEVWERP